MGPERGDEGGLEQYENRAGNKMFTDFGGRKCN